MAKGFVKNAGNVLKDSIGIKALRSKLDDLCFIMPRRIFLGKDEPDGVVERPIRVSTPKGERVSLIRSDYVGEGTVFKFKVALFNHKEVDMEVIDCLMQYGKFMGFGQWRNGGYGQFEVIREGGIKIYGDPNRFYEDEEVEKLGKILRESEVRV